MKAEAALIVRPVAREDFAAWKPLWDAYNAFYGRHGATALPEAVTQTTWHASSTRQSRCMPSSRSRRAG